jgi:Helix-turn-helix domain
MTEIRCYTVAEVREKLRMPKNTFLRLRAEGKLPFLEELRPRLGRIIRYRAKPIDDYLTGQWGQSRFFGSARRRA